VVVSHVLKSIKPGSIVLSAGRSIGFISPALIWAYPLADSSLSLMSVPVEMNNQGIGRPSTSESALGNFHVRSQVELLEVMRDRSLRKDAELWQAHIAIPPNASGSPAAS
jgi:hypothetical protein